jgi:hypothetical protein
MKFYRDLTKLETLLVLNSTINSEKLKIRFVLKF